MSEGTWQRCVGHLQEELPAQQFNTWIRPLRLEVGDGWIRLLAPNRFVRDWVNDRFFARIRELVSEFSPEEMPINIELAVADRQPPPVSVPPSPPVTTALASTPGAAMAPPASVQEEFIEDPGYREPEPVVASSPVAPAVQRQVEVEGGIRHQSSLMDAYTFETFVEGKSNQLARAAASQVAENP